MKKNIPSGLAQYIKQGTVCIFSKSYCPYCDDVKTALDQLNVKYNAYECDNQSFFTNSFRDELFKFSGFKTFPQVFIGNNQIGGCSDFMAMAKSKQIFQIMDQENIEYKK